MIAIDWNEYKAFKAHSAKEDRFIILIDFMKSYYNMNNPGDMFEVLKNDDIGNMLLERKEINDAEGLENFMFKL